MRKLSSLSKVAAKNLKVQSNNEYCSLALSVHFKQPSLGMKKYEILSRASAFLLGVDPPSVDVKSNPNSTTSIYSEHLQKSIDAKKHDEVKQNYAYEPAGGPSRNFNELNWLEFLPKTFRPCVHVLCSSHVIAPWKWPEYYAQDWISAVSEQNVTYSLDLMTFKENKSLAKFALTAHPIHHPNQLDVALLHLKEEEAALKTLKKLGCQVLYLRNEFDEFQHGEDLEFHGFEITHDDLAQSQEFQSQQQKQDDDERIFTCFTTKGKLSYNSSIRFLSTSEEVLPQGVCGGPVLSSKTKEVVGIVEGIVPLNHAQEHLRGSAAFIPSPLIRQFVDIAEEFMVKQIAPPDLYENIQKLKTNQPLQASETVSNNLVEDSTEQDYYDILNKMEQTHGTKVKDGMVKLIEKEKQEVLDILDKHGGDVDEVIKQVTDKTIQSMEQDLQFKEKKSFHIENKNVLQDTKDKK